MNDQDGKVEVLKGRVPWLQTALGVASSLVLASIVGLVSLVVQMNAKVAALSEQLEQLERRLDEKTAHIVRNDAAQWEHEKLYRDSGDARKLCTEMERRLDEVEKALIKNGL